MKKIILLISLTSIILVGFFLLPSLVKEGLGVAVLSFYPKVAEARNIGSLQSIVTPGFSFKKDLQLGDTDQDILQLQKILNADPNTVIAIEGEGSPGRENTYFGALTKAAVIKFQNKYWDIVLDSNSIKVADGAVNKATRTRLNLLIGIMSTLDSIGLPQSRTPAPVTYVAPTIITTPTPNPVISTQPIMSTCSFVEFLINIGAITSSKVNAARSVFSCNTVNVITNPSSSVDLRINGQNGHVTVNPNSTITISWNTSGVVSCVNNNNNSKSSAGSEQYTIGSEGQQFTLTCRTSSGVNISDSVLVKVAGLINDQNNVVPVLESNPTGSGTVLLTANGIPGKYKAINSKTNPTPVSINFTWTSFGFSFCKMISDLPVAGLNNTVTPTGSKTVTIKDTGIFSFLCENEAVGSKTLNTNNTLPNYLIIDLTATSSVSRVDSVSDLLTNDAYKTTKLVLKKIPAGIFTMGSPEKEPGRRSNSPRDSGETQHQVTITNDYYMAVFKTTQAQYKAVMGSSTNPTRAGFIGDKKPVTNATWDQVRGGTWPENVWPGNADQNSFMKKLSQKAGISFDLPTEAMWEYAARAGSTKGLTDGTDIVGAPSGGDTSALQPQGANTNLCVGGYGTITDVGTKNPNNWGLYDVHCNVSEWVLDWTSKIYQPEISKAQINPTGLTQAQAESTYFEGPVSYKMTKNDISQGMGGMRLADKLFDIWDGGWDNFSDHPELHAPGFRIAAVGSGVMAMKNIDSAQSTVAISELDNLVNSNINPDSITATTTEEDGCEPGIKVSFAGIVESVSKCVSAGGYQIIIGRGNNLSSDSFYSNYTVNNPNCRDVNPYNTAKALALYDHTSDHGLKVGDCVLGSADGNRDAVCDDTDPAATCEGIKNGNVSAGVSDGGLMAAGVIKEIGAGSGASCVSEKSSVGSSPNGNFFHKLFGW